MKLKVFVKNVNGLVLPVKANPDDAAYDVVATSEPNIVGTKFERPLDGIKVWSKIDYIEYKTNLFLAPEDVEQFEASILGGGTQKVKFHIEAFPRSSLSKKNLVLAYSISTLDNGYRGEVFLRFKYIFQPEDYIILQESGRDRLYAMVNPENIYQKGDKIVQLKAREDIQMEFEKVIDLPQTQRGAGGFGSTGK